jgi:uncharacterized damage-inducible protein DinB
MAENNSWANHRLYGSLAKLTRVELGAERTSFFPSLRATLKHILLVDWYYIDALARGGLGRKVADAMLPFEELDPLRAAQRTSDARLVKLVADLESDAALDERVLLAREKYDQHERVGDVLLHLIEHQIHHRGQVHAMLSGTRVPPPQLDEFFLEDERPLREVELRELGLRVR